MAAPSARVSPSPVERFYQFSLLGMLASGWMAVASTSVLDFPTQILVLAALALHGIRIAGWLRFELGHRVTAALTIASVGFFAVDYEFLANGFPAASLHLIVCLVVLKLLTAATDLDYGYLKMIAVLALVAAAMITVSMSFFVYLTLFLLFTCASLTGGEIRKSSRRSEAARNQPLRTGTRLLGRRLGLASGALFSGILILTAGLFFILPRTARAALNRFAPHLTGFSNTVNLDDIGKLKRNGRVVMHVRTENAVALARAHWRGAVLPRFDGMRWSASPGADQVLQVDRGGATMPVQPHRPGRGLSYVVHLEEVAADTLFFAGTPETISINLPDIRVTRDGSFHVPREPDGVTYAAYSVLEDESAPATPLAGPLPRYIREEALTLPPLDPRIAKLAESMVGGAVTDGEKARIVEARLRHDYGYTLDLPTGHVRDPIADFLFVRRKGHCEYFASAMAVMLRTLDIPSRVITGFQSGVYSSMARAQVIRESDAHAWVEAWIPGSGWTTFDPTPADPSAFSMTGRLSLILDAADQFWQDWILSYDLERQVALASRMQESGRRLNFAWLPGEAPSWGRLTATIAVFAGAAAFAMLTWMFGPAFLRWRERREGVRRARRGEGQPSDATLLYQRMLAMLARRGYQKPPWLTPQEFARVLPPSDLSALVEDLTSAYTAFRFGGRREVAPRIIGLLEELERQGSAGVSA
jgi:hypothetical protein